MGTKTKRQHARQPSTAPLASKGRLIVGIDPGTTRLGIAYAAVTPQDVHFPPSRYGPKPAEPVSFTAWPNSRGGDNSPITALYYPRSGGLPLTGHPLAALFRNQIPEVINIDRLVRLWKILFHDAHDSMTKEIQDALYDKLRRLNKTPDELFRDWVEVVYRLLFTPGLDNPAKLRDIFEDFDALDLEIVIPVPPGRSVIAHASVIKAFAQGLVRSNQIFLVSEVECLFRWWANEQCEENWEVGKRYLAVDIGGGFGNLVRYRVTNIDPPAFSQEFDSESIVCGAETISNEFAKLADSRVLMDCEHRDWVLDRLRREFDEGVKDCFADLATCNWAPEIGSIKPQFTHAELAQCFQLCISKLVDGIKRHLDLGKPVDVLVFGGGLCNNHYIMKILKARFENPMKFQTLPTDKSIIAKGAALTRISKENFLRRKRSRVSMALLTMMEVTTKIRNSPLYKKLDTFRKPDGEYFWAGTWILKKDDDNGKSYNIDSEEAFQKSRIRWFKPEEGVDFTDSVYHIDYCPGRDDFAPMIRNFDRLDESGNPSFDLLDMNGNLIPSVVRCDAVRWNPHEMGVNLKNLEKHTFPKNASSHSKIRYSVSAEMNEVQITYHVKAWDITNKTQPGRNPIAKVLDRPNYDPILDTMIISKSLQESWDISTKDAAKVPKFQQQPSPEIISSPLQSASDINDRNMHSPALRNMHAHNSSLSRVNTPFREIGDPHLAKDSTPTSDPRRAATLAQQSLDALSCSKRARSTEEHPDSITEGVATTDIRNMRRKTQDDRSKDGLAPGAMRKQHSGSLALNIPLGYSTDELSPGCRTCKLQSKRCTKEQPVCSRCSESGLVCEYTRLAWVGDKALEKEQKKKIVKSSRDDKMRTRSSGKVLRSLHTANRVQLPQANMSAVGMHGSVSEGLHPEATPSLSPSRGNSGSHLTDMNEDEDEFRRNLGHIASPPIPTISSAPSPISAFSDARKACFVKAELDMAHGSNYGREIYSASPP